MIIVSLPYDATAKDNVDFFMSAYLGISSSHGHSHRAKHQQPCNDGIKLPAPPIGCWYEQNMNGNIKVICPTQPFFAAPQVYNHPLRLIPFSEHHEHREHRDGRRR